MEPATDSLVDAIEVWRPDGDRLAVAQGFYGSHGHVAVERDGLSVASGDGPVGDALASGVPVAKPIDWDAAGAPHGLSASHTVAIPAMQEGLCRGVVSLHCGEADDRLGAFEVWRPNERSELALVDGWHANLERFRLISSHVKFPRRAGLPGKVWNDRFPRVLGRLAESADFVRAAGAKADGLSTALGIPIMRNALEIEAVLLLLSASRSPIARVMEVWAPEAATSEEETPSLRIVSADYGPFIDIGSTSRRRRLRTGEGIAGRVFQDQAPWLTTDLLGVEFPNGEKLVEYGFRWGVGLPVFVGEDLLAVVTMLN